MYPREHAVLYHLEELIDLENTEKKSRDGTQNDTQNEEGNVLSIG